MLPEHSLFQCYPLCVEAGNQRTARRSLGWSVGSWDLKPGTLGRCEALTESQSYGHVSSSHVRKTLTQKPPDSCAGPSLFKTMLAVQGSVPEESREHGVTHDFLVMARFSSSRLGIRPSGTPNASPHFPSRNISLFWGGQV